MTKRNSLSGSKRGFIETPVTIIVGLFIFGLLAIIGYQVFGELNTDVQASDLNPEGKELSSSLYARYPATIDGAFLFMFILLWILMLVALWFMDSNPLFLIVIVVIFTILLVAAGMFSNFWEEISTEPDFDFATSFPSTYFILNNFLLVMVVVALSGLFAIYMKGR